jgi:hypothetical protein
MKLLLYMFEMIVGLKINFSKSEILMINDDENWDRNMLKFLIVNWVFFLLNIWEYLLVQASCI